ncbi:MAG: 4Fe-4S dicluster domain-containing protein [bacterium]
MKAILTDTTKCIGCRECVIACKKEYDLELEVPRRWALEDGLSARNWTSIVQKPGGKFIRKQCRHCIEPACVSACPVQALRKTPEGAVIYDSSRCMGCRYCMMACPYGIPRYDWDQPVPYVRKCILCYDRIKCGSQPACTAACPTQATIFGDREELLTEAHRRIKNHPGKYLDRVWGEKQVGGTQVLYISDIDLSCLTYNQPLGEKPLPKQTAAAMTAVPFVFVGVGSLMAGISWIIGRRMKLLGQNPVGQEDKDHE